MAHAAKTYVPQVTEFTASWMNDLENAVEELSLQVEELLAGASGQPGWVLLDSFVLGGTDDQKLAAAMAYCSDPARTYIPGIQFPFRNVSLANAYTAYSGMSFRGPGPWRAKDMELDGFKYAPGLVTVTNSTYFMSNAGTVYNVSVENMVFYNPAGNCQWWRSTGANGLYACDFANLSFYGFENIMGNVGEKCLLTQVTFTGHWTVLGFTKEAFTWGGADNSFWMAGEMNINSPSSGGAAKWMICFDGVQKSNVGFIYCTAEGGWRGTKVLGSGSAGSATTKGLRFFGGVYEGRAADTRCDGNIILINMSADCGVAFIGCAVGYAMGAPAGTEHGVIEVINGNVTLRDLEYHFGNTAITVPFVYQQGGFLKIRDFQCSGGSPRIQSVGGTMNYIHTLTIDSVVYTIDGSCTVI